MTWADNKFMQTNGVRDQRAHICELCIHVYLIWVQLAGIHMIIKQFSKTEYGFAKAHRIG